MENKSFTVSPSGDIISQKGGEHKMKYLNAIWLPAIVLGPISKASHWWVINHTTISDDFVFYPTVILFVLWCWLRIRAVRRQSREEKINKNDNKD